MSTTVLGTGLREYHGARLCRQPSTSTVVLGEYQYHVWCGACVSMNRMSSEHAQGGVVGSRLCAHACRGAGEMECAVARASKAGNSPGMG